ncbi:MAG: DUF3108 domain-containing protein [Gammaproteobacteria bacterium]
MRARPAVLIFGVAGLLAAAAWPAPAPVAADPAIRAYSAVYEVHYNNKRVGTSEFSVRYDTSRGIYRFSSSTAARGVLKIIRPRPIVERSEFVSEAGTITPLEFWFEDGSRRGHDNFHILFDWDNEVAVAETEDGRQEFPLAHGTLDRGTMQIQVMLDMAQPGSLGSYTLTDDDGLTTYDYRADGDTLLETPYGSLSTQAFIQERAGSSRRLLLWAAPELHYLPVRIEQQRDGETRSVLVLESVEWLNSAQD